MRAVSISSGIAAALALSHAMWVPPAWSQSDRCEPNRGGRDEMQCVHRNGHCIQLAIDGETTKRLTDPATIARLKSLNIYRGVCWRLEQPVSTNFRLFARDGGLRPEFVGAIEQVSVQLYAIEDFDPKLDSRLEPLSDVDTEADGYRNGTWQMRSKHPLKSGEYVAIVRINGASNWDSQGVLLRIDAARTPIPAQPGQK
ncbi:MAG: hypothetical protein ACRDAM_18350 [Casimicrobium sp.]